MIQCPCCGEKLIVTMRDNRAALSRRNHGRRSGLRFNGNSVWVNEEEVRVTPMEYRLLSALDDGFPYYVPYEMLVSRIYDHYYTESDWPEFPFEAMKVYAVKCRRKLINSPYYIKAVWGKGFVLERFDNGWRRENVGNSRWRKVAV